MMNITIIKHIAKNGLLLHSLRVYKIYVLNIFYVNLVQNYIDDSVTSTKSRTTPISMSTKSDNQPIDVSVLSQSERASVD